MNVYIYTHMYTYLHVTHRFWKPEPIFKPPARTKRQRARTRKREGEREGEREAPYSRKIKGGRERDEGKKEKKERGKGRKWGGVGEGERGGGRERSLHIQIITHPKEIDVQINIFSNMCIWTKSFQEWVMCVEGEGGQSCWGWGGTDALTAMASTFLPPSIPSMSRASFSCVGACACVYVRACVRAVRGAVTRVDDYRVMPRNTRANA